MTRISSRVDALKKLKRFDPIGYLKGVVNYHNYRRELFVRLESAATGESEAGKHGLALLAENEHLRMENRLLLANGRTAEPNAYMYFEQNVLLRKQLASAEERAWVAVKAYGQLYDEWERYMRSHDPKGPIPKRGSPK